jgi:hypothetical protein
MHFDPSTYDEALKLYNQCYDKSMTREDWDLHII